AARCSRWSAHGWIGHSGRRAVEDGNVRISEIQSADSAGRHKVLRSYDDRSVDHRHCIWRTRRDDAAGYEEACRLFLRQPHGIHNARHVRSKSERIEWKYHPTDQSRNLDGRAVFDRRIDLRSAAYSRDFGVWRHFECDAGVCSRFLDYDDVFNRSAAAEWLHR